MSWSAHQTRLFARAYKKLHHNTALDVDKAVALIAANPEIGDAKKGDLAALRVYKFRSQNQQYLLGYTVDDIPRLIYLESLGPHENLYRDLKQ